jgi:hypothetical protein
MPATRRPDTPRGRCPRLRNLQRAARPSKAEICACRGGLRALAYPATIDNNAPALENVSWLTSSQNPASVPRTQLASMPAPSTAFIRRRMRVTTPQRTSCLSIRWNVSTAARASRYARFRPSSPAMTCRRSGPAIRRKTPHTLAANPGRMFANAQPSGCALLFLTQKHGYSTERSALSGGHSNACNRR